MFLSCASTAHIETVLSLGRDGQGKALETPRQTSNGCLSSESKVGVCVCVCVWIIRIRFLTSTFIHTRNLLWQVGAQHISRNI